MKTLFNRLQKYWHNMPQDLEASPVIQMEAEEDNQLQVSPIKKHKVKQATSTQKAMTSVASQVEERAVVDEYSRYWKEPEVAPPEVRSIPMNTYQERAARQAEMHRAQAEAQMAMMQAQQDAQAAQYADAQSQIGGIYAQKREHEEVYDAVRDADALLLNGKQLDMGGGVALLRMGIEHRTETFDTILTFDLLDPDGNVKNFKGPVHAFRDCYTYIEIVMRALQHGEG